MRLPCTVTTQLLTNTVYCENQIHHIYKISCGQALHIKQFAGETNFAIQFIKNELFTPKLRGEFLLKNILI